MKKKVDSIKAELVTPEEAEKTLALQGIASQFEKNLQELDDSRGKGWSLTKIWRDSVRMHDDNALMRQNAVQLQVVLQQTYQEWMQARKTVGDYIDKLDVESEDFEEKYKAILKINAESTKLITHVTSSIRSLKQEMRQTEFQSKFFCHINLVQQFLAGVTGILHKHLQSSGKLDAIMHDIQALAKIFKMQEQGIGSGGGDSVEESEEK